ncbi:MAG: cation:proton antiporter [Candidatus Nanoarchaeia archaeon]
MDFIVVLLIFLSVTYLISWAFRKVGLPSILGHMTTGLVISIPQLSNVLLAKPGLEEIFSYLANLGLIFLLFFIGLKINIHDMIKFSKKSVNVALLSAIIPFILGYLVGQIFDFSTITSVILGASLSITAEAVSAAVLEELNLLNTKIGTIILEAGIFDDIFEILTIATVGTIIQAISTSSKSLGAGVEMILFDIVVFIAVIYLVRFFFIPFTFKMLGQKRNRADLFTFSFIIVLLMASLSNYLELGTVIGALIAGIVVKQTLIKEHKEKEESDLLNLIKAITFGFLEPIFFIWMAYQANIFALFAKSTDFFILAGTITLVATAGKLLGPMIASFMDKQTLKEGIIIGWGMNARGAVELIAVQMAYNAEIIPPVIYSSVIFMTFITTIISPVIFKYITRKHHN